MFFFQGYVTDHLAHGNILLMFNRLQVHFINFLNTCWRLVTLCTQVSACTAPGEHSGVCLHVSSARTYRFTKDQLSLGSYLKESMISTLRDHDGGENDLPSPVHMAFGVQDDGVMAALWGLKGWALPQKLCCPATYGAAQLNVITAGREVTAAFFDKCALEQ